MPRKRRKLSKEMEADIAAAQRKVELVMAMIHDIADEDTQGEYLAGFGQISAVAAHLAESYQLNGFCEETEGALALYRGLLERFEEEYELWAPAPPPWIVFQIHRDSNSCWGFRAVWAKFNRRAKSAKGADLVRQTSDNEKHSSELFSMKSI